MVRNTSSPKHITSSIDVTGLLEPQSREFGSPEFVDLRLEMQEPIGSSTATVAISVFVAAAMFLGIVVSAMIYVQRRRRRQVERDTEMEPERTDGCEYSFLQFSSLIIQITVPIYSGDQNRIYKHHIFQK